MSRKKPNLYNLKLEAHELFDKFCRRKHLSKANGYHSLARLLGVAPELAHFSTMKTVPKITRAIELMRSSMSVAEGKKVFREMLSQTVIDERIRRKQQLAIFELEKALDREKQEREARIKTWPFFLRPLLRIWVTYFMSS